MLLQKSLFPFLTLLFLVPSLGERCRSSADCNDNLPCSIDYCDPGTRRCINVSNEPSCNTTRRSVSRAGLIRFANSEPISLDERRTIIQNTALILNSLHPHRLLHINLLGVDPVADLEAYEKELVARKPAPSNVEFHERMFDIFQRMDDFHTVYLAPTPLISTRAFLPFSVREYYEEKSINRSYVVSDVALGFKFANSSFGVGSIITKWNGERVDNVVLRLGKAGFGSNKAAQIANGIHDLHRRFVGFQPFPLSDSVTIHFRPQGRTEEEVKVDWIYATGVNNDTKNFLKQEIGMPDDGAVLRDDEEPEYKPDTRIYSSDPGGFSAVGETMRSEEEEGELEEPGVRYVRRALETGQRITVPVNESFCGLFTAEVVPTSSGAVGRLLLSSFSTGIPFFEVIREFGRVLRLMPSRGLIVDVRGNGGGLVALAKIFTDLLTPKVFEFTTFTVRATALTEQLISGPNTTDEMLLQLRPAMKTARLAGNPYVNTIRFNFPAERVANAYNGSYVILADGLTYSSGDLFTAIHKDNDLAPVVVVGGNVGAGGSTVLDYSDLSEEAPLLFPNLPGGVDFSTSVQRLLRTGTSEGAILENFGVLPDVTYRPTLRDRLENDKDLFEVLGKIVTNSTDMSMDPGPSPEE